MTDFKIHRSQLLPALSAVRATVEKRKTIPILSNVLIADADDGAIAVTGTDLDIKITCRAETMSGEAGREGTTLPIAQLFDIVNQLPESAEISIREADGYASVSAGRSRFKLPALPSSDYPQGSTRAYDVEWTMPGRTLDQAIGACEFAISTEETRYYLNGIFFHVEEDGDASRLAAVATNGNTLARIALDAAGFDGFARFPDAILPAKACRLFRSIAAKAGEDPVTISASESAWRMTSGGTAIETKLIAGTFPDYRRVIPEGNPNRVEIDGKSVVDACKRIRVVSSRKERAARLDVADSLATLTIRDPEGGEAVEDIQISLDGEPLSLGLNIQYLADVVDTLDADTTVIELADATSPIVFRPLRRTEGVDKVSVVMPMRIPV